MLTVMQHQDNQISLHYGRGIFSLFRNSLQSKPVSSKRAPTYLPEANQAARAYAKQSGGIPQSTLMESLLNMSTTAHILGGCPIGKDRDSGVIDTRHQVFGYPGLYGEPMVYSRFLAQFLRLVREENIHVNIETCGIFKWQDMAAILPFIDLIFFDLKHMDPKAHKRYTGADNGSILNNFKKLTEKFNNLQARMPVIPGINDDEANVEATARFINGLGHRSIHCLPYHNLGEAKIRRIHTAQAPLGLASMNGNDLSQVKKIFKREKIDAVIYD